MSPYRPTPMRIIRHIRSLLGSALLFLASVAQGQVAFEELPSATHDDNALGSAAPNAVLFDFTNEDYPFPGAIGTTWKLADYHLSLTFHTGEDHVATGSDMAIGTFGPVKVKVRIEGTTVMPVALAFSEVHELVIDHEHPEAVLDLDYTTRYHGFRRLKVYLESYDNSALPAAYQGTTELLIKHRRRKNISPGINNSSYELVARSITSPGGNRLRFNWDHGTHAPDAQLRYPAYRFELLRLYNMPAPAVDPGSVTDATLNATRVDWSQALSLDLEAQVQQVDLVLAEGTGFYVWRVRPLTDYYEGGYPDPRNWGAWSDHTGFAQGDQPTGLTKSSTPITTHTYQVTGQGTNVFYYEQFDETLNWSYSRVFSEAAPEEGIPVRSGEHMTFATGLQQVTQEQTHLSSLGYPMIVETFYDHAGRAAVKTLPVPAPDGQHAVGYQPDLMEADVMTPRPYGPADFDTDGSYLDNSAARSTNGFEYYTSSNTAERQVPYAGGYPFTRSLFYPDGRVKQQSAPGEPLSFTGTAPKTSRTYYGAVSAAELARVFGEEAYEAVAVHKVLTIDPNGVLSMAFQDKEGKTLATCLGPYGGTALEPLSPSEESAIHIHDEVLQTTQEGDFVNKKSTEIVSPGNLTVMVTYELDPGEIDPCYLACTSCDYTIEFFAYNKEYPEMDLFDEAECNNGPIYFPPGTAPARFDASCQEGLYTYPTCTLSLAEPGTYVIGRRIRVNNPSTSEASAELTMNEHLADVDAAFETWFAANTIGGASLDTWIGRLSDGTDDQTDLNDLYEALDPPDGNGNYHIPFGGTELAPCREIVIPHVACDECNGTTLPDSLLAYLARAIGMELTAGNFDDRIDDLFDPGTVFTYFAYPGSGRWDIAFDRGLFEDLIANMLAEPGTPAPYPCDKIKACWQNAVDLFLTMQDNPLPPIDPGTIPGNSQTGPITLPEFHLMDIFLDCTGRNIRGWSSGKGGATGYLSNAINYFYYPEAPFDTEEQAYVDRLDVCIENLSVFLPGFDPVGTPADLHDVVDYDGAGDVPGIFAAQALFDCMNNVDWATYPAPATSLDDGIVAMHDDCFQACYSHRDEFRAQVLAAEPGILTDVLDCYVNAFLNSCYTKCNDLDVDLMTGGMGDADELAFQQDVLLGRLEVSPQVAGECASGWWPVNAFDPVGTTPGENSYPPIAVFPDMPLPPSGDMPEMASMLNTALDHVLDFLTHYSTDPDYALFGWKAVRGGITDEADVVEFAWDSDHPGFQVCKLRITGSLFDGTNDVPLMNVASADPTAIGIRKIEITLGGTVVFRFIHQHVGPVNVRDDADLDLMMQAAANGFNSFTDVEGVFTFAGGLDFVDRTYIPGTTPPVTTGAFLDETPNGCVFGIDGLVSDLLTAHTDANDLCWQADNSWTVLLRTGCVYQKDCTPQYCFRFERGLPTPEEPAHPFDFHSCATINAQLVASALSAGRAALKSQALAEFEHAYRTTCADPTNISDGLFVDYTLDQYHYTLYYYDRAGRLMTTVPPKGVDRILIDPADDDPENENYNLTEALAHTMAHTMKSHLRYNSLGQPTSQKTPNGGIGRMYYDLKGRLRISRDARQLADAVLQPFSYTKYDDLDRIVEVGQGSLVADNIDLGAGELGVATLLSAAPGFPANGTDKTVTVYTTPATDATFLDGRPQRFLLNRVSYAYSDKDGSGATLDDRVITYYSYDPHGNVEWIIQEVPRLGRNYVSYEYDLLSGRVLRVHYNPGRADQFHHRYAYDEDGRLLRTETSTDEVIWDRDATASYYPHGPLRRTELGEDHVQGLDYSYTLQGWLKGINSPTLDFRDDGKDGQYDDGTPSPLLPHPGTGRDAFGMALRYFNADYTARSSVFDDGDMLSATRELFNGNIAAWSYRTRAIGNQYDCCLPPDGEPWVADLDTDEKRADYFSGIQGNRYTYDVLNRLRQSDWHRFHDINNDEMPEWVAPTGHDYRETFAYDPNGNITDCVRNGFPLESLLGGSAIDDLHYNYDTPGTDQLFYISESIATAGLSDDLEGGGLYYYDPSGNLVADQAAGISDIAWTPYGKIQKITYSDGRSIGFGYDAAGQRVWKVVRPDNVATPPGEPSNAEWTFYVRDAQGNPMAIYRQWEQLIPDAGGAYARYTDLEEEPLYGSSRLGSRLANVRVEEIRFEEETSTTVPPPVHHRQALQRLEMAVKKVNDPALGAPYIYGYNPDAADAGTVAPNGLRTPGITTSNIYRAEDDNGSTLYSVYITDRTNVSGQHYTYAALRNAAGQLMFQSTPITAADPQRATLSAQVPNAPDQHYLFTLSAAGKPYAHRIDLVAQQLTQADIPLTLPGDPHYQYGKGMAVIDDRTVHGGSFLYLKRYRSNTAQLIAIDLDRLAANDHVLTADMVHVLDSFTTADQYMAGELQVSPDGHYLALAHLLPGRMRLPLQSGSGRDGVIRLYALAPAHQAATYLGRVLRSQRTINSLDFSSKENYVYWSETGLTTAKFASGTLCRALVSTFSTTPGIDTFTDTRGFDVRHTADGSMLLAGNQGRRYTQVLPATTPDESDATPAAEQDLGAGYQLLAHMALQPLVITASAPIKHRSVGEKRYELTDHLGNVRVTLSDINLGDWDAGEAAFIEHRPQLLSRADYYAFGWNIPGQHYASDAYRFGFQGQEKDDEIHGATGTSYSYEHRMLDPRVGRWLSMDPKADKYPHSSPYAAMGNNPLIFIDEKGEDIVVYLVYADGTKASQPLLVVKSDKFVADYNLQTQLPNLEKPVGDPLLVNPFPAWTPLTFDLRPVEGAMSADAYMVNAEAGFSFGGGVAGSLSGVLINKGEDQGFHLYGNFGVRFGLDAGVGVSAGPIDFNEDNSAGEALNRKTFVGWSQGMNVGAGEASATTVSSYVGGEICGPFSDCEPLYNGVLVGGAVGPDVSVGASYYFSKSTYLGSFDPVPAEEQPAATTGPR